MNRRFLLVALGTMLFLAASVFVRSGSAALIINANLYGGTTYNGPGAAGSSGTWNQVFSGGSSATPDNTQYTLGGLGFVTGPLQDATGSAALGITFSDQYVTPINTGSFSAIPLLTDFIYTGGVAQAEISNVPAGTYDLYLYSQNGTAANLSSNFTIGVGGTVQTVTNAGNGGGSPADLDHFQNNVNYTEFTSVTPTAGNLLITFTPNPALSVVGDYYATLNGFQLVAVDVPEPSSFVLLGIGLAATVLVTRRRK